MKNLFNKIKMRGETVESTKSQNGFLLFSNLALSLAVVVLAIKTFSDHEVTRLVPPGLSKAATVGWDSSDPEYKKSFGMYVAILAGNINAKNATFVVDQLSTLVTPRIYTKTRVALLKQVQSDSFTRDGVSTVFSVDRLVYEPAKNRVFAIGTNTVEAAGNSAAVKKPWTYEMVIVISEGKPVVDAITNYAGSDPHTEAWRKLHPEEPKPVEADQ